MSAHGLSGLRLALNQPSDLPNYRFIIYCKLSGSAHVNVIIINRMVIIKLEEKVAFVHVRTWIMYVFGARYCLD